MCNEIEIIDSQPTEVMTSTEIDNVLYMAARAEQYVAATKRVMEVAISVTKERDWTIISGQPYLQESGATAVAALFGVSVEKLEDPQRSVDTDGYVAYTYKLRLHMNNRYVDSDGCRSMRDDFFCKTKAGIKKPDEIDEYAVKKSAYTNALVRGLKTLIPGLRNIDIEALERAGLNPAKMQGYKHKTGSQGGSSRTEAESGHVCADCGAAITDRVASYSYGKYGRELCMNCQKAVSDGQA